MVSDLTPYFRADADAEPAADTKPLYIAHTESKREPELESERKPYLAEHKPDAGADGRRRDVGADGETDVTSEWISYIGTNREPEQKPNNTEREPDTGADSDG